MNNLIFILIGLELMLVAWWDVKHKKISNYWVLTNILLAIFLHMMFSDMYPLTWEFFIFPVSWILIGFVLFLAKIMGAGDSKFLASLFLLIPHELHMVMFEKLLLTTIIVGLITLTFKVIKDFQKLKAYTLNTYWKGIIISIRSRFSYAPVIVLAWLLLGVDLWK